MRIPKYRAWHKFDKKMYEVTYFNLDKGYIGLARDDVATSVWSINDIELMQYTGLKDKNGKEIYEGDVLKCFHYDLLYQAVWLENDLRFAFRNTKNPTPFNTCCIGEIIGNIYENPELLEWKP